MSSARMLNIYQLHKANACLESREDFRRLFGDSVDITPEVCSHYAAQFAWSWAAQALLSPKQYDKFKRQTAPFWKAVKEHGEVLRKQYEPGDVRVMNELKWNMRGSAPMHRYNHECAVWFARCYIADGENR